MLKRWRRVLIASALCRAQDQPASDFVNQHLPEWLRFSGELRVRYEGFSGAGFSHDSSDDHVLTRVRINMTVRPSRRLAFVIQAQDARVFLTELQPVPPNYQDKLDVRIAYVEIGADKDLLAVRAGRQELDFGEQRMLGYNGWRNTAQSFDAVRLIVRHAGLRLDIFASAPVLIQDRFNRVVPGNNIHGKRTCSIPDRRQRLTIEPYLFWRLSSAWRMEAGGFGRLDVKYPGAHMFGKAGALITTLKLPLSSAIPVPIGFTLGPATGARATRDTPVWSAPTGSRSTTTRVATVIPPTASRATAPYPATHDRYGLADQVGWKNLHHVRTGVELALGRGWHLIPNVHNYWLASNTDGLFTPSNIQLARVESGARSRRVGWEADLSALWSITRLLEAGVGYARLFPGAFLKEATQGVAYNYGYCYLTYRL